MHLLAANSRTIKVKACSTTVGAVKARLGSYKEVGGALGAGGRLINAGVVAKPICIAR